MPAFCGKGVGAVSLLGRLALVTACCLLASCFGLFRDLHGIGFGELTIQVAEDISRNIVPSVDMTVATYDVSGAGPDGATFFSSFTGSSVTQRGLVFGEWTITAEGRNAEGVIVTWGTEDVRIETGTTQAVDIVTGPVTGPGTLTLSVTWDPASVDTPAVQAQLVPSMGLPVELAFAMPSAGEASYANAAVQNGYYTLVVRLLDNAQLVMGAVDVVRIVAGETTSGTIDFTDVNSGTGTISVGITLEMNEPVQVTLSGQAAELGIGEPMTVTAAIPAALGNGAYVWYLNGVSVGTGSSITLNAAANPLSRGPYRLDVCAFASGGARGGSTTCVFAVVEGIEEVTLEWNPNLETDLAGYRVYVGTSSGTYLTSIDVGLVTECTVTHLSSGQTYWFAATAYDTLGAESVKSEEISYVVP